MIKKYFKTPIHPSSKVIVPSALGRKPERLDIPSKVTIEKQSPLEKNRPVDTTEKDNTSNYFV